MRSRAGAECFISGMEVPDIQQLLMPMGKYCFSLQRRGMIPIRPIKPKLLRP